MIGLSNIIFRMKDGVIHLHRLDTFELTGNFFRESKERGECPSVLLQQQVTIQKWKPDSVLSEADVDAILNSNSCRTYIKECELSPGEKPHGYAGDITKVYDWDYSSATQLNGIDFLSVL